jgi:hypothetical protein
MLGCQKDGNPTYAAISASYELLAKENMTIKPSILISRNVVLDTSFFYSKGFNFRNEEMLSLSKLGACGTIQILIVDLTLREVENNMREAAKTAHSKLGQSDFSVLRTLPLFRRFNDIMVMNVYLNTFTKAFTNLSQYLKQK